MSTWISDKKRAWKIVCRAFFLAIFLPVGACIKSTGGLELRPNEDPPLKSVSLFAGDVMVSAPQGYCLDRSSLRQSAQGSFVLMASCANLSAAPSARVPLAVITVAVLPAEADVNPPTAAELATAMAPSQPVQKVDSEHVSLVRLAKGGDAAVPGGDPSHWRGYLVVNDHLIGLALYAPKGSTLTGKHGKRMVSDLAKTLHAKSAMRSASQ